MNNTIWVVLGVFAGLIGLIAILKAVRARQDKLLGEVETAEVASAPAITNRAELVAVVASCVAEVMGKDVTGLRIVSIKQVG
jgi:beta-lactamase regulating signal transducer with metallopeptidase domain